LKPTGLNANTVLILVNAVYFKGDWSKKFDVDKTEESFFNMSLSKKVKASMMFMEARVSYGVNEGLHCRAVELPYVGKGLSMIIILPTLEETSLSEVENKLDANDLNQVNKEFGMKSKEVNIWLPRFKLEETLELRNILAKLGIVDLFEGGKANLSGMDGRKELYVSAAVHKAYIEVNEEGSEATASTASVTTDGPSSGKTINFRADHPFLFFIRHNATNAILFLGRVMKP
jgi:serpin B